MIKIQADTPSFGVEFEFLIAVLDHPGIPNPNPRDPRNVYFPPTEHDGAPSYFTISAGKEDWANEWSIYAHVKRTLSSIGLPTEPRRARSNFSMWEITRDGSIQPPRAPPQKFKKANSDWQIYRYVAIEVRTPAYYYTEDALRDVRDFCRIMRKSYLTTLNESCGLHVHIGYGHRGFELPHLRRIATLLHAFEPQLESLHPEHRIDDRNLHCSSFRRSTYWQWKYREEHERLATVLESMAFLMGCETREAFREAVHSEGSKEVFSYMGGSPAWKFESMGTETRPREVRVPDTIECRQHAGSLDPDEVVNWVRTVVGLVQYAREADPYEFRKVLWRVKGEKWMKGCPSAKEVGKRRYLPRATLYRPVFGEQWCGVVDLLRVLGLKVPAAYYEERLGRWLENGVYRHWYTGAPREYLVAGGDGDEGKDKPLADSSGSSDSRFGRFRPHPRTREKKEEEKEEKMKEKKKEKFPSMDLKHFGIDTTFSDISSEEEQKSEQKSSSPEDFPMRLGATKLRGREKAEEEAEKQPSAKEEKTSSSSEDFPMRPSETKHQGEERGEAKQPSLEENQISSLTEYFSTLPPEEEVSETSSMKPIHSEGLSECSRGSRSMTLTFEDQGPNTMEDDPWGSVGEGEGEKDVGDDVVEEKETKEKEARDREARDKEAREKEAREKETKDKKKKTLYKYLPPLSHTPLPPLAFPSNFGERTPNQHSHLLNNTTPAEIEALAPDTENYRGSLLHRRDRRPSSPWLSRAPNIASLSPNRSPYPGPSPWMGWEWNPVDHPAAMMHQFRAQLADALEEGTMGQAWVIDHQMPATREEGIRNMLQGLQLDQVSPSLEPFLAMRNRQLGRIDHALLYNMFPARASDPTEFEKQDDEWWRFEVAGATIEELQLRLADDDPQVVRDAQETLLRIGGDDGTGDEYWPEGARNPFGDAERMQQPVEEDISPGAPNSPNHRFPVGYRFTEGYQGPEDHEGQAYYEARERKGAHHVMEGSPLARQRFRRGDNELSPPRIDENELEKIRNAIALENGGREVVDDSRSSSTMGDDQEGMESGLSSPFLDSPLS